MEDPFEAPPARVDLAKAPLDGFGGGEGLAEEAPPLQRRPVMNPRRPADAGLSVLGLLMRTVGFALALAALTGGIAGLIIARSPVALLVALLCAVRSGAHMQAGVQLAQFGIGAAQQLRRYLIVAGIQSLAVVAIAAWQGVDEPVALLLLAALLMAWPAVLLALWSRPDFAAALRVTSDIESDRLLPEDRGFVAVGLLMVGGGAIVLPALLLGIVMVLYTGALAAGGFVVLAGCGLMGLFAVRAFFGLQAGRAALQAQDPRRFYTAFGRYSTTANVSLVVAALFVLVTMLFAGGVGIIAFLVYVPMLGALHAWPRSLQQYLERNLPELTYADERLPPLRRPRDAGLSGLGAVLLAFGAPWMVTGVATLLGSSVLPSTMAAQLTGQGPAWVALLGAGTATVAGWCLFNMTSTFRVAAVAYGLVAGGLAIWNGITTVQIIEQAGVFQGASFGVMVIVQVWTALALPLLTLWVALRHEDVGDDVADQELARAFD